MKPAPFRYLAPSSVDEALAALAEHGESTKLLAGGQSLVPLMNLRLASPTVLVDLNRVDELAYVRGTERGAAVGAMTRHRQVVTDPDLAERAPLVASAAAFIGYPPIRSRGTIGGSLAHADPVAEMPCVAMALDAELVAVGPAGSRVIPADGFFRGVFTTELSWDEILVEIRFPASEPGDGWGFEEFARKSGDFAIAAVAVHVRLEGGTLTRARIALAGASDRPLRAVEAEASLAGRVPDRAAMDAAAELAATVVDAAPEEAAFRRQLVRTLTRRSLRAAVERAGGAA